MTPADKVKTALAKVGITTANPTPREAAEKAFHKAEGQWLRMGPIHGPDRLKAALDAYDAELRARRASGCVPVPLEWIEMILNSRAPDYVIAAHGVDGEAVIHELRALLSRAAAKAAKYS